MWLLAGNTRLMAQTGHGNKIPVKVIDYDGEIKQPTENNEMIGGLPSPSRKLVKKMKRQGHTSVPYGSGYEKVEEGMLYEYSKFKLRIPSDIKKIHKLPTCSTAAIACISIAFLSSIGLSNKPGVSTIW